MLVRITGSGFVKTGSITDGHPVEFRHWKDVVEDAESFLESAAHSEEEEAVVELWLEDPMSFQQFFETPTERAEHVGLIRRADRTGAKTASVPAETWEESMSAAKTHINSMLANLGNGRR